jgi:hypothetical protein
MLPVCGIMFLVQSFLNVFIIWKQGTLRLKWQLKLKIENELLCFSPIPKERSLANELIAERREAAKKQTAE